MSTSILQNHWVFGPTPAMETKYEVGAQIGQPGSFGYAVQVRCKETGELRACKVINKSRFVGVGHALENFRNEITIMRELKHDGIIHLHEHFEDKERLFLVMELCSGGELFDAITERGRFTETDAASLVRQVMAALAYMHERRIAHCDLKPDNFLFTDSTRTKLKVIDFGLSKVRQMRSVSGGTRTHFSTHLRIQDAFFIRSAALSITSHRR